jgi:hypothetical protein
MKKAGGRVFTLVPLGVLGALAVQMGFLRVLAVHNAGRDNEWTCYETLRF